MNQQPDLQTDFDTLDWGDDADEEIVAACDLSSPTSCESCQ